MRYWIYIYMFICVSFKIALCTSISQNRSSNACPKKEKLTLQNGTVVYVLKFYCCADFHEVNKSCIACPPGYYGKNCNFSCLPGRYGIKCRDKCNCTRNQTCDATKGCVSTPDCSTEELTCDNRTGVSVSSGSYEISLSSISDDSNIHLIQAYIGMAAVLIALVFISALIVHLKQMMAGKSKRDKNSQIRASSIRTNRSVSMAYDPGYAEVLDANVVEI